MATLFFFLGSLVLIIALAPLWAFIAAILWQVKYIVLAIVLPIAAWFIWAGCMNFWYH